MRPLKRIEISFERLLWSCRFFVILPVIFSLFSAMKFFIMGTLDIWAGIGLKFDITDPEGEVTSQIVSYIIGGIDYYLIGIVLLIFSVGIYELLISEIHLRFEQDVNILKSESLEDLKSKLVKVIVVALIVNLFKKTLSIDISEVGDLVYVSLSILLIAVSNYLLHLQYHSQQDTDENKLAEVTDKS